MGNAELFAENPNLKKTAQATAQKSLEFKDNNGTVKITPGTMPGKVNYSETDNKGKTKTREITNEQATKLVQDRFGEGAAKQFQEWAAKQAQLTSALMNNEMAKNVQENFLTKQGQELQTEKIESAKIEGKSKDAELIAANFENMLDGGRKRGKKEDEGGKTTEA